MRRFKSDDRPSSGANRPRWRRWLAVERRLSGNVNALALEMTARHAGYP